MLIKAINQDKALNRYLNLKKQNIDFEREVPVSLDNPELLYLIKKENKQTVKKMKELSLQLSFRNAIKSAKKRNENKILILEDDALFTEHPDKIFNNINNLPKDFGICFLGTYFRPSKTNLLKKYNEDFLEICDKTVIWGAHAIIYNSVVFDYMIKELSEKVQKPYDSYLCSNIISKYKCYVCNPMICFQDKSVYNTSNMHGHFHFDVIEKESIEILKFFSN